MNKKVDIITIVLAILFIIGIGMIMTDFATKIDEQNIKTISDKLILWPDPEKGVEYWIYVDGSKAAMTARYNADGTLSIAEGY